MKNIVFSDRQGCGLFAHTGKIIQLYIGVFIKNGTLFACVQQVPSEDENVQNRD